MTKSSGARRQKSGRTTGPEARAAHEAALLARNLHMAIVRRDNDAILDLVERGINPSVSYTSADPNKEYAEPFTPVWSLVLENAQDLMKLTLGENLATVPLATNYGDGKGKNLFEMLAEHARTPGLDILYSATELLRCMAPGAPGVGDGLWKIVDGLLTTRGAELPGAWQSTYAGMLMGYGAVPPNPQAAESLLGRMVQQDSGIVPFAWMIRVSDRDGRILQSWLDVGMSPDAKIGGVPLLHHLAAGNHEKGVEALICAGADVTARCDANDLIASCPDIFSNKKLAGQYTATELAQHLGAHDAARMIGAHLAHMRIKDVLQRTCPAQQP